MILCGCSGIANCSCTFLRVIVSLCCVFCVVGGVIDGSSIYTDGERLTWNPPEFPQGMIIRYEVLVNGSAEVFTTPTNEIDINSLILLPGVYFVQVCSIVCAHTYVHTHTRTHTHTHTHTQMHILDDLSIQQLVYPFSHNKDT